MDATAEKIKPERHGQGWDADEERRLYDAYVSGTKLSEIAEAHGRTRGGIRSHLITMGMLDEDGVPIVPEPTFAPSAAAAKRTEKAAARPMKKNPVAEEPGSGEVEVNARFAEALDLLADSDKSVFVTGKAGTGKSTLLKHFRRGTKKNVVVLAPTGIAALNVGGQTIHNFFRFGIDVTLHKVAAKKKVRNPKLYAKLETIVIDEVSMVRADILDCIDAFLQLHGPRPGEAFGGVQMVFIGDLYQLPPVVGQQDRAIFADHYDTPYFFSAHVMQNFDFQVIELEKVYRQKDHAFVALLNRVRNNTVTDGDIALLNSRLDPVSGHGAGSAVTPEEGVFSITLTATNQRADDVNTQHLSALKGRAHQKTADVTGDFGREYFPTSPELSFKIGAQVMMLNNDKEGRWVNGSIGIVEAIGKDIEKGEYVSVRLQDEETPVAVFPHQWEVYRFALADNQIQSEPVGTFTQYPFRLAWAVTIHKSQGKTFNRVTIDIGAGAFAAGQVYVALSRCTTFEGILLKTPIQKRHIQTDARIQDFWKRADVGVEEIDALREVDVVTDIDTVDLIEQAIRDKAALDIVYLKGGDEKTARTVYPRALGMENFRDTQFLGMRAFCMTSREDILFSVERILQIARAA
ncbi:MAG: AAA family ATPase [Alphaproteobacteria bacterium]|nr:AAA family ATPase [Alphaproteobacteria bacterium]